MSSARLRGVTSIAVGVKLEGAKEIMAGRCVGMGMDVSVYVYVCARVRACDMIFF